MSNISRSHEAANRPIHAPHLLSDLAQSTRAKMFVAILSLGALNGCATIGSLFGSGKAPQHRPAEDMEASPENLANLYLSKAREATSSRLIQRNNYQQAIVFYREALSIFPAGHTNRKAAEAELAKIENSLKEFERQYRDTQSEVDKALTNPSFTVESIDQLYVLFYKLQMLRVALGKEDRSLYEKAIGEARRRLSAGDYVTAYYLCDIAQKVDFSEGEIVRTTQVTKKDMETISVVRDRNEKEMARRRTEAERLSQLAIAAFNEKKMEEVRRLIDEVRKLETKDFKAANQLASKINSMSRSGRRSRKPVVVATAPVTQASETSNAASANEGGEDIEEIKLALGNLVSQFNAGDKFEAIAGLERAIKEFAGSSNIAFLTKQRSAWNEDRNRLVASMLESANGFFLQRDAESRKRALEIYGQVLELDPKNQEAQEKKNILDSLHPKAPEQN